MMYIDGFISTIFGILLGIIICIPIGPINLITIRLSINGKRREALFLAFGGSLMDAVYFFVLMNGINLVTIPPILTLVLKLSGVILIFLMGAREIYSYFRPSSLAFSSTELKEEVNKLERENGDWFKYFLYGVVIYTTNPTLIATMSGLSAFVKSTAVFNFNMVSISLFSLSAGFGTFVWIFILTKLVLKHVDKIGQRLMEKLNLVFGALMCLVAIFMGTRLVF